MIFTFKTQSSLNLRCFFLWLLRIQRELQRATEVPPNYSKGCFKIKVKYLKHTHTQLSKQNPQNVSQGPSVRETQFICFTSWVLRPHSKPHRHLCFFHHKLQTKSCVLLLITLWTLKLPINACFEFLAQWGNRQRNIFPVKSWLAVGPPPCLPSDSLKLNSRWMTKGRFCMWQFEDDVGPQNRCLVTHLSIYNIFFPSFLHINRSLSTLSIAHL